jgi:outer membrane protein OmpA-like peptidoglycan-associated protein/Tol biopolymer transport system component
MKRKILPLIFFILLVHAQVSADGTGDKEKKKKQNSKEIKEAVREGDFYYGKGEAFYNLAIKAYTSVYDQFASDAMFNYKLGVCYLSSPEKEKAKSYLEKAWKIDPNVHPDLMFNLGHADHLLMQWDKAIGHYSDYIKATADRVKSREAGKKIEECRSGKALSDSTSEVIIDNLGASVNSEFEDYAPVITADGSMLIFTSRRPEKKANQLLFENIYVSRKIKDDWSNAEKLGTKVNIKSRHNSNIGLSTDGQKLLVYRDENGSGSILESDLRGMEWTEPKKLKGDINSDHHESSASYSFDGRTLFFVSERPGGAGGKDIYSSKLNANGEWEKAVNLGAVNTVHDEEGVFAHPDGKTLYFSSKGHNTVGGYDIFKSTLESGQWSAPVNLGMPINTPGDDLFFVMAADGKTAFISSVRPEGKGGKDIYKITFIEKKKEEKKKDFVTVFKGIVTDEATGNPVEAMLEITDLEKNLNVSEFRSNSATGNFLVTLPAGRNYGISVTAPGYLFHSENFNIPVVEEYTEVHRTIMLKKLEIGRKVVLNNIFFDYGKATLRPESVSELDRVLGLMKENPTIKVQISGHTDNQGSEEFNRKLSEERARSVVQYLVNAGVSEARLKFVGYGFSKPVAGNETEEGRQLNRRTEFEIIK